MAKQTHTHPLWYVWTACCLLLIISYILYPLAYVFSDSLTSNGQFSIDHFAEALSGDMLDGICNSIIVSCWSTLGAAVIGVSASLFTWHASFPFKRLFMVSMFAPLLLPPLVGMFAFWLLISDIGFLPQLLNYVCGSENGFNGLSGMQAVILVHSYSFSVYFYALCSARLQRQDPSHLEAARSLGASAFMRFRSIILPQLFPSIISASALCFMLSMGSFSAPYILANSTPFLSVLIYEVNFAEGVLEPQYGLAAALSVIGAILCLAFLFIARRFEEQAQGGRGLAHQQTLILSGSKKYLAGFIAVCGSFLMLLPLLYIVLIACCDYPAWDDGLLPTQYTTSNFISIFESESALQPLLNSLFYATIALVACLAWALLGSYLVAWSKLKGRAFIDICMMLPLALPGTVIAFSLLRAFSIATPQSFGFILAHSVWLMPLAYCVRCLPLGLRPLVSSLQHADPAHDEAARSLGASALRRLWSIAIPHMLPALIAAAILIFVTNIGEFVSSIMLYRHANMPVSVYMFQIMQSGIAKAAAYSSILIGLMLASVLLQRLIKNANARRHLE